MEVPLWLERLLPHIVSLLFILIFEASNTILIVMHGSEVHVVQSIGDGSLFGKITDFLLSGGILLSLIFYYIIFYAMLLNAM